MNKKWIKVIGIAATIIGIGATLTTDWISEKKMDEKVTEKVTAALALVLEAYDKGA